MGGILLITKPDELKGRVFRKNQMEDNILAEEEQITTSIFRLKKSALCVYEECKSQFLAEKLPGLPE
jgi:hypothetical protein